MDATVRLAARGLTLLVAAVLLFGLAARTDAQATADPIEKLRQTLLTTTENLSERDEQTKACLSELRSLSELRKAVLLREWRHYNPNEELAALDRANRNALAESFRSAMHQALCDHEAGSILAALEMLNQTAASLSEIGEVSSLTRPLTADVARLVGEENPAIRVAAARTLGLIDPDLTIALPVLATLTKSTEAALRLDAATALSQLLGAVAQPWTTDKFNPSTPLDRRTTAENAAQLLPLVGVGAADSNREVRQRSLTTLALAATVLARMLTPSSAESHNPPDATTKPSLDLSRAETRPLALELKEQLSAVSGCLRERDVDGKILALKVHEETAQARLRWLQHGELLDDKPDDPLATGLANALPGLAETLTDDHVKVRRATLDVLEIYGPLAAAAAPAVTRALKDPDRFVRWSAVRTLGAIGAAARPAIPALIKLLADPDLDVRVAAAGVLEALDPAGQGPPKKPGQRNRPAQPTVPALIQALKNDNSEMRLAAIHALATMGLNALAAAPALAERVGDADPHVRLAAIRTLGDMGPAARSIANVLQQALRDDDAEVRRAAGEALLNVERDR
jgi:HEAT repeats